MPVLILLENLANVLNRITRRPDCQDENIKGKDTKYPAKHLRHSDPNRFHGLVREDPVHTHELREQGGKSEDKSN